MGLINLKFSLPISVYLSLTLKKPSKTVADDSFLINFSEKIRLDISSESSALQMLHMKCQTFFSVK